MATRRRAVGKASRTPLTDEYIARGDWNPLWDAVRELDPEFVEAYLAFRSVPHRKGPLPPKFKELVLVAINVATTHLYAPGARRHMQNAMRLGATAEEILEVIQLTTVMGIHSVNMAVPMLCEELRKAAGTDSQAGAAQAPAPAKTVPAKPAAKRTGTPRTGTTRTATKEAPAKRSPAKRTASGSAASGRRASARVSGGAGRGSGERAR